MKRLAENRSADQPRRTHRGRRWVAGIAATLVLLLTTAFGVLRVKFEGEDLGDNVADILNKKMRGRISIGSIEWPSAALEKVVSGGWVPLTMRDVHVYDDCALSTKATADDQVASGDPNEDCTPDDRPDPDPASRRKPRKLLLQTDLITAEIDIHALMFGHHDFVFRNLWVYGGEALLEQTREPYPLHAYERTVVSIVSAFYPRMHAGFRAGIYADAPPPIFDLRDIHFQNLNLTLHMAPTVGTTDRIGFGFTLRVEGVDIDSGADPKNDSYLYADPTDPLVSKFYVRLGVTGKHGLIRIVDEGPRSAFKISQRGDPYPARSRKAMYELELTDIRLDRLAQLPTQWARHDFVANNLELDLSAKTLPCKSGEPGKPPATGATLHIAGELNSYFDRPYDGSWNLKLEAQNLGPTIHTCIKSAISGDNLNGTISLTGPFVALPKVGLDLKNLDFDVPLRKAEPPLQLALAEVHGSIDLVNDQGYIEKTRAIVRGKDAGEIDVSATFGLKPYNGNASIEIRKAIDLGRFLPPQISGPVGRFLTGRLTARGDVSEGFALEDFDLALGATPNEKAIRAHHGRLFTNNNFASIQIEKVYVEAGQSHAQFDGFVDVANNDMKIFGSQANFPDLDVWLKRFRLPAFAKSAPPGGSFTLSGKLTSPRLNARTTLTGVPCIDKLSLDNVSFANGILDITQMSSAGLGGSLTGAARVRTSGIQVIEKLHLDGSHLDASRVCGLEKYAKGTIDGVQLDLHGTIDKTRAPLDWMDLATIYAHTAHLTVLGDNYSNVAACINRTDREDSACRPRPAPFSPDDLGSCTAAKKGGSCAVISATRDIGGTLDGTIAKLPAVRIAGKQVPARLAGTVAVSDIPMAVLDQFTSDPLVGGLASATLHLSGTPVAPQATGAIQLLRAWALGGFLGDPQLAVEPTTLANGAPGLKLHGLTLAGRLEISGIVGTTAPFPVEMVVGVHRVEIDQFLDLTQPLSKLLPALDTVQAWVTGTITVRTELRPASGVPAPEAWIELSELQGTIQHHSADNRIVPLSLTLADARTRVPGDAPDDEAQLAFDRPKLSVHLTRTSFGLGLELACRDPKAPGHQVPCSTKLATPAGIVVVSGQATAAAIALEAHGKLSMPLIAPLLDKVFDHVVGSADLTAVAGGTLDKPTYEASLDLHELVARPTGSDTVMEIKTGIIKFAKYGPEPGSLGFTDLEINVKDQNRDEHGEITVHGGIKLDGITPVSWGMYIDGNLAAKMLLVLPLGIVSQANGVARIGDDGLRLWGKGPRPMVAGSLEFDPRQPATVTPRALRRELSFSSGSIDIATCSIESQERSCPQLAGDHRSYLIQIDQPIRGKIDNVGDLTSLTGEVTLGADLKLAAADLALDAERISFVQPHTLDLVLDVEGMHVTIADQQATVRGKVIVVNGAYTANFELTDRITKAGVRAVPTKPFWESIPYLPTAKLDLVLDVRKFQVDNNIATVEASGKIDIGGTPRDPELNNSITIAPGGSFRVPGTRAAFISKSGAVTFSKNERATNPRIDLISEADYTDLTGQEHIITATITGPLEQLQWDLKTSTGYNKSQTLTLLVLGRNPEQLRRSLGDQALGVDPTHVDPSTNPSQGFADQIVKDLAGGWVSDVVGNNLKNFIGVDVLRIEIGFGSVGVHVEKKVADNLKVLGEVEQTILGHTLNINGVLKLPYQMTLQAGYLDKQFDDPAQQDISDANIKFAYRLFIP